MISIASWKRRKFNESFMERLFDELGISLMKCPVLLDHYRIGFCIIGRGRDWAILLKRIKNLTLACILHIFCFVKFV